MAKKAIVSSQIPLTGDAEDYRGAARHTYPGQASFACKPNQRCRRCGHAEFESKKRYRCGKFFDLVGKAGSFLPMDAIACRYYIEAEELDGQDTEGQTQDGRH